MTRRLVPPIALREEEACGADPGGALENARASQGHPRLSHNDEHQRRSTFGRSRRRRKLEEFQYGSSNVSSAEHHKEE